MSLYFDGHPPVDTILICFFFTLGIMLGILIIKLIIIILLEYNIWLIMNACIYIIDKNCFIITREVNYIIVKVLSLDRYHIVTVLFLAVPFLLFLKYLKSFIPTLYNKAVPIKEI